MGVDNVLAVGGAAQGSLLLVILGLAISIPIVVWGSTLVVRWVERFPVILWGGAAVLGWTAAKMIGSEPLLAPFLDAHPLSRTLLYAVAVGGLVAVPLWRSLSREQRLHGGVLVLLFAWLTFFGWVEREMGAQLDVFAHWQWDNELIDLVRWVGWIPVAMLIRRRWTQRR
jgi:hypothetical protein